MKDPEEGDQNVFVVRGAQLHPVSKVALLSALDRMDRKQQR